MVFQYGMKMEMHNYLANIFKSLLLTTVLYMLANNYVTLYPRFEFHCLWAPE